MKKILYYARVCYLDAALEYLNSISSQYEVHLIIGISPKETKENIFDLNVDLNLYNDIEEYSNVVDSWGIHFLDDYFKRFKSINFLIYKHNNNLIEYYKVSLRVVKFLTKLNPHYVHFDDFSFRQSFLIPYLIINKSRIIMNIHDPLPHSGESISYTNILKKIIYRILPKFVTFSEYSKFLLNKLAPNANVLALKLLPYNIYCKDEISYNCNRDEKTITFLGRLSVYKGLDLFAKAIQIVNETYPNQKFLIAGKSVYGYDVNYLLNLPQTIIKNRFITNTELSEIFQNSKAIVCPYKDATQSGVIMTAYAFNIPVIVSNVGGLAEYVQNNQTGLVMDDYTSEELAKLIIKCIENDLFLDFQKNIKNRDNTERDVNNNILSIKTQLYL